MADVAGRENDIKNYCLYNVKKKIDNTSTHKNNSELRKTESERKARQECSERTWDFAYRKGV